MAANLVKFYQGSQAQILASELTRSEFALSFANDTQVLYKGNGTAAVPYGGAVYVEGADLATAVPEGSRVVGKLYVFNNTADSSFNTFIWTGSEFKPTSITVSEILQLADGKTIGTTADSKLEVKISATAGNAISANADGLFVASLKLSKLDDAGEGNASSYQLVDEAGNVYGDPINIAKDQFLKNVELTADDDLVFTFVTTDEDEKVVTVDVSKYIDTYTAGQGITITDKEIKATVKAGDKYLEVTADGISSKGIDEAIAAAVEVEDGKVTALTERVATLEGEMDAAEGRLDTAESEIAALKEADTALDGKITAAQSAAEDKAAELDAALETKLNQAIEDSKFYWEPLQ